MSLKFFKSLQVFILLTCLSPEVWALDFRRYHDQDEIAAYLRTEALNNPELVKFQVLGRSQQGREIAIVSVSKGQDLPAIYFNGTHHGNERASTEAVLALLDHLVQNADKSNIDKILRRYTIILHPLVNPDGHAMNLRTDSKGVDPNRDYASPSKSDREAFQLPETRVVRELHAKRKIVASGAFHSGLEAVLWPWCHTPTLSEHDPVFRTLAASVAKTMQMERTSQSFYDYQTDGEYIDFAYMRHGTYALTFEVSHEATPAAGKLPAVVQRAVQGSLSFIQAVDDVLDTIDERTPVMVGNAQVSL